MTATRWNSWWFGGAKPTRAELTATTSWWVGLGAAEFYAIAHVEAKRLAESKPSRVLCGRRRVMDTPVADTTDVPVDIALDGFTERHVAE